MFRVIGRTWMLLLVLAATSGTKAFGSENRVALVIGNSAYLHAAELANPKNDAEDMAAALQKLEFKVIKGLDLDKASMDRAIRDFAEVSRGASIGVFFYAGHGLQVSGRNYLVPIDAQLKAVEALDFEMVGLDVVQRTMESAGETNVLFVDACRDNPLSRNLARAMGTRSTAIGSGLVAQEAGAGTLISFSTQPGNVALDGTGSRNSPYAAALAKHISTQEKDLAGILVLVRRDVVTATAKRQVPWEHSALMAEIRLAPPAPAHKSTNISESGKASPGTGNATELNTATAKTVELVAKPEPPTKPAETRKTVIKMQVGWLRLDKSVSGAQILDKNGQKVESICTGCGEVQLSSGTYRVKGEGFDVETEIRAGDHHVLDVGVFAGWLRLDRSISGAQILDKNGQKVESICTGCGEEQLSPGTYRVKGEGFDVEMQIKSGQHQVIDVGTLAGWLRLDNSTSGAEIFDRDGQKVEDICTGCGEEQLSPGIYRVKGKGFEAEVEIKAGEHSVLELGG